MTMNQILARAEAIRRYARDGDYEAAHIKEQNLRADFIRWLSTESYSTAEVRTKAAAVATTSNIDFPRWSA